MKLNTKNPLRAAIIASLSATSLFAQEAASAPTEKSMLQTYVIDGGPTMIFIGIALLLLIGLVVYNHMMLTRKKFCPDELKAVLFDHMANCRVRSAIEVAASSPTFLGRMLAYALPNIDATRIEDLGRDKVEDAIADFTANESRKSMTWISLISLDAQAAPMLGLFGTVLGMVAAFAKLGQGDVKANALAGDISVALLTTLWGLVVAISAICYYFIFKNKYNSLVAECHNTAEQLINASLATINAEQQYAKIPEGLAE